MGEELEQCDKVELHGWHTVQVPTRALFELSDNAYKVLGYLVFRARGDDSTFVGIERMAKDLSTGENIKKAESTVRKALKELRDNGYIYRQRRMSTSSLTHIFERQADYDAFIAVRYPHSGKDSYPEDCKSATPVATKENTVLQKTQNTISADAEPVVKKILTEQQEYVKALTEATGVPTDTPGNSSWLGKVAKELRKAGYAVEEIFELKDIVESGRLSYQKGEAGVLTLGMVPKYIHEVRVEQKVSGRDGYNVDYGLPD